VSNSASQLVTVTLTICAVIITGLVFRRELLTQLAGTGPAIRKVENRGDLAANGHLIGSPNAMVSQAGRVAQDGLR
jgi:hypothetical protein